MKQDLSLERLTSNNLLRKITMPIIIREARIFSRGRNHFASGLIASRAQIFFSTVDGLLVLQDRNAMDKMSLERLSMG